MTNQQQSEQRHLAWEACYNTRDLGGLPTTGNGQTRWRAVIRSDLLGRLTAQGKQALLDYGVRTIIDLRGPKEVAEHASAFMAANMNLDEPTYLNLPLEKYVPHVSAMISEAASQEEVYTIILDHYPDRVADVLRAIANARPGSVVVHCHAGNDRTGIVSALLLSVAGVPAETIIADYAESQTRLWPLYQKSVARPDMMQTMLAHLDSTYGSVERYLDQAGFSATEREHLKRRLCSPAE